MGELYGGARNEATQPGCLRLFSVPVESWSRPECLMIRNPNVNVTYYGYNGFIVEVGDKKLAIDPGTSLYLLGLGAVIPKTEWAGVTHVLVTHADPDHYWNTDRLLAQSGAPLICGAELVEIREDRAFIAHPRKSKVKFSVLVDRAFPLQWGEDAEVDGVRIRALPAHHGDLRLSFVFGALKKTVVREPNTLFAKGETGFLIEVGGVSIANLGDTLRLPDWQDLTPDVLLIPIGGREIGNTMNEDEALQAVSEIKPKLVIPCHYNCGIMFRKKANSADAESFKRNVEATGVGCMILEPGQSTAYPEQEDRSAH